MNYEEYLIILILASANLTERPLRIHKIHVQICYEVIEIQALIA